MASPGSVVIQFLTDTGNAIRNLTGLGKALGKVEGSADDVDSAMRDTQRAIDKTGDVSDTTAADLRGIETSLDSVGDEAATTAQRLRESARDMVTGIGTAETGIGSSTDRIKTDMSTAGAEAGTEFISNIAEGIGSGTANINDIVSGTLGGLTNLTATLSGPVGIAAGAAAAGIGLVFAAVTGQAENAKAKVTELTTSLQELGTTSGEAAEKIIWDAWVAEMSEAPGVLSQIETGLENAGVKGDLFKKAISGNVDAQKELNTQLGQMDSDIDAALAANKPLTREQQLYLTAQKDIRKALGDQETVIGRTAAIQDDLAGLAGDAKTQQDRYTTSLEEGAKASDDIRSDIASIPSDKRVTVHVDYEGKKPAGVPGSRPMPGVAGMAAPVVVNVTATTNRMPNTPRALIEMLETHQVRMGRRAGTPRAVAW